MWIWCLRVYVFFFPRHYFLSPLLLPAHLPTLSSSGLGHVKVPAVFPVLTFYAFVTATWFKLALLPSAVWIRLVDLVHPLQLLLCGSMTTFLSPGEFITFRWLYIRRSFACQIKNLRRGFSGRSFYLFPDLWASYSAENMESASCYAAFWEFNQLVCLIRTLGGRMAERRQTKGRENSVKWDWNPCDCCCMGLQANGLKAPWRSVVGLSAPALCRPNPIWPFLGFACSL